MRRALVLASVLASTAARADTPPSEDAIDLTIERQPPKLRMRARTAAVPPTEPASTKPSTAVAAPTVIATSSESLTDLGSRRDLERPISVRFNLGYVVDGAARSGKPNLNEQDVPAHAYGRLRAYALGEGYLSTRGVVFPSLSTYFATRFQLARPTRTFDPSDPLMVERTVGPPVATWFDKSGFEPRAAWAEVKDFLPDRRLAPLRLRAGELYVYGPWVLHMYGLTAAWEGKLFRASVYGGSRVPDYTISSFLGDKNRAGIAGSSVRIDLRALKRAIPFAISAEALAFTAAGAANDQATNHATVQFDWRPRQDFALIGKLRALDGELANEHIQLRSRYKQVTNLVFDITHRRNNDWRWDPSVPNDDPLQAQRALDLGPVVPQLLVSGRAGTLIKENVDVLLRGALARDLVENDAERNTYAASYVEAGGGLEVRLRRTIGLGLHGLTRQTERYATITGEIADVPGEVDVLPRQYGPELGERGFTELGTTLRMSLGARRLSALVEVYGRKTRYALDYCAALQNGIVDPSCMNATDTGIDTDDYRGGGRFTIDAWIGSQLRLFASYELSSRIDFAREINGFKSLRLMMEGVY